MFNEGQRVELRDQWRNGQYLLRTEPSNTVTHGVYVGVYETDRFAPHCKGGVHLSRDDARRLRDHLSTLLGDDGKIVLDARLGNDWTPERMKRATDAVIRLIGSARGDTSALVGVIPLLRSLTRLLTEAEQGQLEDGWYLVTREDGTEIMRYRQGGEWACWRGAVEMDGSGYTNIRKVTVES